MGRQDKTMRWRGNTILQSTSPHHRGLYFTPSSASPQGAPLPLEWHTLLQHSAPLSVLQHPSPSTTERQCAVLQLWQALPWLQSPPCSKPPTCKKGARGENRGLRASKQNRSPYAHRQKLGLGPPPCTSPTVPGQVVNLPDVDNPNPGGEGGYVCV